MYTAQYLDEARRRAKRSAVAPVVLLALAIALLVAALVIRVKWLAYLGLILPAMAAYFAFDVFCAPLFKYAHFVADLLGGRSHRATGRVLAVSGAPRHSEEGVPVRDVVLRAQGEDVDTLFYWDDRRPAPQVDPDRQVTVTAYGRYIIEIEQNT